MALSALLSKFSNMSAGRLPPVAVLGKILCMWLDFCLAGGNITGIYLSTVFCMSCVNLKKDLWTQLESSQSGLKASFVAWRKK